MAATGGREITTCEEQQKIPRLQIEQMRFSPIAQGRTADAPFR
jgi:hypothetical protein